MQRLPPILPINRIRQSHLEEEREPDGREFGGQSGAKGAQEELAEVAAGDTVTLRSRVQQERFEEEEEGGHAMEPVPQDSLDGAVQALGANPATAQAAQGPGVDRNNAVKIL